MALLSDICIHIDHTTAQFKSPHNPPKFVLNPIWLRFSLQASGTKDYFLITTKK